MTTLRPAPTTSLAAAGTPIATVLMLGAVVAALWYGRSMLIPLALAVLISFALAPPVVRLRRLGLGQVPAVLAVVLVVTAIVGVGGFLVAGQISALGTNLPTYEQNLRSKIREARAAMPSGGVIDQASKAVEDLSKEINDDSMVAKPTLGRPAADVVDAKPIPVEIHERAPTAIDTMRNVLGPLVGPVATAAIIIVFVIFMLIEQHELRDRLIRLIDERDLNRATKAIEDAAKRVSRYLLMQLLVAVAYGVPYGFGLWLIGVPNPILWGVLACVLRFVPFVGPVIAAAFPLILALSVDTGWSMIVMTVALIAVLELVTSNILEPWLYGSTTGLSTIAILVAAVFWTTLWGPVGLLLSVPLTVCLVVLGRHVPALRFLDLLLGDRPALTTSARIYQRLLANDRHEALALAEDAMGEGGLAGVADETLLPVLRFAEHDRERRSIDAATEERLAAMVDGAGGYLAEVDPLQWDAAPIGPQRPRVLCLGGRNSLDLTSAGLLARALEEAGIDTKTAPAAELSPRAIAEAARVEQPDAVCLAYLSAPSPAHARRLVRRLRSALPNTPILACHWFAVAAESTDAEPPAEDAILRSVTETVADLRGRFGMADLEPPAPARAAAATAAPVTAPALAIPAAT